ncbi:MAG: hypothetical protein F7B60_03320 [Desulfurococcales archaeon]|nr:hypothetical protein [Desulfurococcales archaeon]
MKSNKFIALETTLFVILILILVYFNTVQKGITPNSETSSYTNRKPPPRTAWKTSAATGSMNNFRSQIRFKDACKFLKLQEVDNLGLLAASNEAGHESQVIYLLHDNYLAIRALEICGATSLAEKINENLGTFKYTSDSRYNILFGKPYNHSIPRTWYNIILRTIPVNGTNYTLMTSVENESGVLSNWIYYADWLALKGIDSLWKGNEEYSLVLYSRLLEMWTDTDSQTNPITVITIHMTSIKLH